MARIKIKDLREDRQVSQAEMRRVMGRGLLFTNFSVIADYGTGEILTAFPDVCLTPSPGGPVPIPYPNVGSASDSSGGSKLTKTKFG